MLPAKQDSVDFEGCRFRLIQEPGYVIYSAVGSFYAPMLVMMFFNWRIFRTASKTTKAIRQGVVKVKGAGDGETTGMGIHRGGGGGAGAAAAASAASMSSLVSASASANSRKISSNSMRGAMLAVSNNPSNQARRTSIVGGGGGGGGAGNAGGGGFQSGQLRRQKTIAETGMKKSAAMTTAAAASPKSRGSSVDNLLSSKTNGRTGGTARNRRNGGVISSSSLTTAPTGGGRLSKSGGTTTTSNSEDDSETDGSGGSGIVAGRRKKHVTTTSCLTIPLLSSEGPSGTNTGSGARGKARNASKFNSDDLKCLNRLKSVATIVFSDKAKYPLLNLLHPIRSSESLTLTLKVIATTSTSSSSAPKVSHHQPCQNHITGKTFAEMGTQTLKEDKARMAAAQNLAMMASTGNIQSHPNNYRQSSNATINNFRVLFLPET